METATPVRSAIDTTSQNLNDSGQLWVRRWKLVLVLVAPGALTRGPDGRIEGAGESGGN